MRREYKSGTAWCWWRWKDVLWQGELYLRRLILFQCPLFSVMVHFINSADMQEDLHDHPVSFLSFILKGWYLEDRGTGAFYNRCWWNYVSATDKHKIVVVPETGVITLCFATARKRDWGFHTKDGWVYWKDYHDKTYASTS